MRFHFKFSIIYALNADAVQGPGIDLATTKIPESPILLVICAFSQPRDTFSMLLIILTDLCPEKVEQTAPTKENSVNGILCFLIYLRNLKQKKFIGDSSCNQHEKWRMVSVVPDKSQFGSNKLKN